MSEEGKHAAMKAYFKLEDCLYGDGQDKPIEIKSAMVWGALSVLKNCDYINWNEMRNMYGEFMSKQMGLR